MIRIMVCILAIAAVTASMASAAVMAPEWSGQAGSTYQKWEFNTSANPAAPDVAINVNGDPSAIVVGSFPGTFWKPTDRGHTGVWRVDEMMEFQIPNFPEPNPIKEIWLNITYDAGPGSLPDFFVMPQYSTLDLIASIPVDDLYVTDTYRITIEPNPPAESIFVMPRYCEIYIDEVVIETICVPEPASMSLLALGSLAWLRRRR